MTLKQGSSGTNVRYLQMNLNGLGFNCGKSDGIYGRTTESAVRRFQIANRLSVDGIAGKNTLSKIDAIIKNIQSKLKQKGFLKGNIDGIFGNNTRNAVIKFQKTNGLKIDGIVGKNTLFKLNEVYKPEATPTNKIYRVQVGAYRNKKNAETMLNNLKKDGYDAFIKRRG